MPGRGERKKEKGAAPPEKTEEEKRREAAEKMGQTLSSGEHIPVITLKSETNAIKKIQMGLMKDDPTLTEANAEAQAIGIFISRRNERAGAAAKTEINRQTKSKDTSKRNLELSNRFKTLLHNII